MQFNIEVIITFTDILYVRVLIKFIITNHKLFNNFIAYLNIHTWITKYLLTRLCNT